MLTAATNIDKVQKAFAKAHKKTLFAESEALNQTAKKAAAAQRAEAQKAFDRPTPFLLNGIYKPGGALGFVGIFSRYSTLKAALIPGAPRGKFSEAGLRINTTLALQADGGVRTPSKRALVVPTAKSRKNKYGNLSRTYIKTLLAKPNHVSLGPAQGLPAGIYRRGKGGKLDMLVAWEPQARYTPRYRYYQVAQQVFSKEFRREFSKAFEAEMKNLK